MDPSTYLIPITIYVGYGVATIAALRFCLSGENTKDEPEKSCQKDTPEERETEEETEEETKEETEEETEETEEEKPYDCEINTEELKICITIKQKNEACNLLINKIMSICLFGEIDEDYNKEGDEEGYNEEVGEDEDEEGYNDEEDEEGYNDEVGEDEGDDNKNNVDVLISRC